MELPQAPKPLPQLRGYASVWKSYRGGKGNGENTRRFQSGANTPPISVNRFRVHGRGNGISHFFIFLKER